MTSTSPLLCRSSETKSGSSSILAACLAHAQDVSIVVGPAVFALLLCVLHLDDGKSGAMVAAMCWVFIWWVTEAVPLGVTSLVPLFLFPFLQIETASTVSKSYMNDTVFLIIGSFILAAAVRYHDLHKRLALRIVLLFGSDPRLLLFGFCIGSFFISMWVDNAAAAAMLMPMAAGVQQKVHAGFHPLQNIDEPPPPHHHSEDDQSEEDQPPDHNSSKTNLNPNPALIDVLSTSRLEKQSSMELDKHLSTVLLTMDPVQALKIELDFCRGVSLCIAYGVTIGGMSTLTGTAVNLVLAGIWETDFPDEDPILFLQWMLFAVPFALILVLVLWAVVCIWFCPPSAVKPVSASLHSFQMEDELDRLGKITSDQILILVIFLILIVLWMTKSLTGGSSGWASLFNDYPENGTVTVLMAVILFVLPNPKDPKEKLLDWSQCKDIPWNIILMIGGGFALADGIKASGLSDVISTKLSFLKSTPYWAITPSIVLVTSIFTEFTSNSATAAIFVPLMAELGVSMGRHPLYLMVPAALGSQLSYMLPIATAPNAIAYATESMRIKDMAGPGIFLKLAGFLFLSLLMPTLGTIVFHTNTSI